MSSERASEAALSSKTSMTLDSPQNKAMYAKGKGTGAPSDAQAREKWVGLGSFDPLQKTFFKTFFSNWFFISNTDFRINCCVILFQQEEKINYFNFLTYLSLLTCKNYFQQNYLNDLNFLCNFFALVFFSKWKFFRFFFFIQSVKWVENSLS